MGPLEDRALGQQLPLKGIGDQTRSSRQRSVIESGHRNERRAPVQSLGRQTASGQLALVFAVTCKVPGSV